MHQSFIRGLYTSIRAIGMLAAILVPTLELLHPMVISTVTRVDTSMINIFSLSALRRIREPAKKVNLVMAIFDTTNNGVNQLSPADGLRFPQEPGRGRQALGQAHLSGW